MNPAIGVAPEVRSNTRLLGLLGMIFSPCFLAMILTTGEGQNGFTRLGAFAGLLFTIGWFCNVLGLLQLRATGKRLPGKILLGVELVGIVLAAIFQVFEFTGFGEGTIFFTITDIAWPLSMLTLLIIGITVAIIGGLRGAARFVPLIAPIWLPLNIVVMMAVGRDAALIVSGIVATIGWFLTGYVVFQGGGFTKRA
jgi:hypothetical protein